MNKNTPFKLYANCKVVDGASISIICDLQKSTFVYIPKELSEILLTQKGETINEIINSYEETLRETITEYFEYLIKKKFIFFSNSNELDLFEEISESFETACIIHNAIIDVKQSSNHDYSKIFYELSSLGCNFIELRFYDFISSQDLNKILSLENGGRCLYMNIIVKYSNEFDLQMLESVYTEHHFVSHFILHSSPFECEYSDKYPFRVLYTKQCINSHKCCGNISSKNFAINIMHFNESLKFNTCLNKKISIDENGYIKNCPSMELKLGHVHKDSIIDIVNENQLTKKYWALNKDRIDTCKDCQFRYICTDCRAFVNDQFDKPQKCNYDPYTHTWGSRGECNDIKN